MNGTKEQVKTLFSGRAAEWAGWYADTEVRTLETDNLLSRQRLAIEMLEAATPPPAAVLDVGCATGEMAGRLLSRGYDVRGVDIAEPMVARARERWGADRFKVGDGERLPFDDNAFDGVVCLGVIEYQDADNRMLAEIRRVLKPGGCAVISTPNAISPLYHLDRATLWLEAAAKPLYYAVKYRLRGRAVPSDPPARQVAIRRYRRGEWFARLRAAGLEPEAFVCRGWGWYRSRLGRAASLLARHGRSLRRGLEGLVGRGPVSQATGAFVRHPALNWLGAEQLVRAQKASADVLRKT
jgi:SAM-dependent methyltransferase